MRSSNISGGIYCNIDLTISEQEQILDYFTENDFTQEDVNYLMDQVLLVW